jgi:hypothetical protein
VCGAGQGVNASGKSNAGWRQTPRSLALASCHSLINIPFSALSLPFLISRFSPTGAKLATRAPDRVLASASGASQALCEPPLGSGGLPGTGEQLLPRVSRGEAGDQADARGTSQR